MKLLLDINFIQNRVILLDNSEVKKIFIHNNFDSDICDNIYVGKIKGISTKLNMAFIDIGLEKEAIMPLFNTKYKIGDLVLVQVNREGKDEKGPRVKDNIQLKGKYIVLLTNDNSIRISSKNNIFSKCEVLKADKYGFIVRSNTKDEDINLIEDEYDRFSSIADDIFKRYRYIKPPALLYNSREFLWYVYRELIDDTVDEIIANDKYTLEKLNFKYKIDKSILNFDDTIQYKIDNIIKNNINNRCELKSGGNIVIDFTEACTFIDVNSFKSSEKIDINQANKEAVEAILSIIDMFDLNGNILIDFIDMNYKGKQEVENFLQQQLKDRKIDAKILGFTKLGIMELSIQRYGKNIFEKYYDKKANNKNIHTVLREIELEILKNNEKLYIFFINEILYRNNQNLIEDFLEYIYKKYNKKIKFIASEEMANFRLIKNKEFISILNGKYQIMDLQQNEDILTIKIKRY